MKRIIISKKFWVILGGVAIILVGSLIFLFSYTYSVSGKITDITNQQAVKGVKVAVAGNSQETNEQGNYKISGIKIYQKKAMVISVPSQYTKQGDIQMDYKTRKFVKDFTIEPTLEELVSRILIGYKNGQYDYLWDLMHADDKVYWESKDNYKNLLSQRDTIYKKNSYSIKSSTIGQNIRQLDIWKSPITDKEYRGVSEVPTNNIMVEQGKEQPQTELTYYQRTDGFYHYFTSVNKDALKKAMDAYNALYK